MRVPTPSRKPCPHCQYLCHVSSRDCGFCGRDTLFRKHKEEVEKRRRLWLDQSFDKAKKALETNKISVNNVKLHVLQQMARLEGAGSACVLLIVGKAPEFPTSLLTYNEILNSILIEKDDTGKEAYSEIGQQMLEQLKIEYLAERIRRETEDTKAGSGTDNEELKAESRTICSLGFMTEAAAHVEPETDHVKPETETLERMIGKFEQVFEDLEPTVENLEPAVENLEPAVIIEEDPESLVVLENKGKFKKTPKKSATKRKRTRSATSCLGKNQRVETDSSRNSEELPLEGQLKTKLNAIMCRNSETNKVTERQLRYIVPWKFATPNFNREQKESKSEVTEKPSVPDIQDGSCYVIVPTDEFQLKNTEAPSRSTITSEEFSLLVRRASREQVGLAAKDPLKVLSGSNTSKTSFRPLLPRLLVLGKRSRISK